MAYINNSTILVDAILTKKGRAVLSSGVDSFNITQFALADDEIDYKLWNPNHTLGAAYYGEAIEHLPILEANADDSLMMKYKLITLPSGAPAIPIVSVSPTSFVLVNMSSSVILTPTTTQGMSQQYVAVLNNTHNFRIVALSGSDPVPSTSQGTVTGTSFKVSCRSADRSPSTCSVTISGYTTGGACVVNGSALWENSTSDVGGGPAPTA